MLNNRFRAFTFIVLSLMCFSKASTAQRSFPRSDNGSQRNHAQLQNSVFPQTKIAECDKQGAIYKSADLSIIIHGTDIVLQGHDSSSAPWTAHSSFNGPGCEIFQADLEVNGKHDLLIVSPGIGSRGEYDMHLTIILFNGAGKPTPWTATGRFSVVDNEIVEIRRSHDGAALIQHNYAVGHPAWGGVSYISSLYAVTNGEILQINGEYSGMKYPVIHGLKDNDPAFQKSVSAMKLSTGDASHTPIPETQHSYPHVVRYGADISKMSQTPKSEPLTPEQGAHIMVDVESFDAAKERLELSDGSKLDTPTILLVDSAGGARNIVFAPESTDMVQLEKRSYEIQRTGIDCRDLDDCRPFILHAIEQNQ